MTSAGVGTSSGDGHVAGSHRCERTKAFGSARRPRRRARRSRCAAACPRLPLPPGPRARGRDAGAAVDAQRLVAARDQKEQADLAGRDDVGQRVEAAVAGRVGDRQVVLVEDRDEAGRSTTRRRVGAGRRRPGWRRRPAARRRSGAPPPRRHPDVLGPRALGRRLVAARPAGRRSPARWRTDPCPSGNHATGPRPLGRRPRSRRRCSRRRRAAVPADRRRSAPRPRRRRRSRRPGDGGPGWRGRRRGGRGSRA